MAGKRFSKGIGTHAESSMILQLDGKAERFNAVVGLSGKKGSPASVEFIVKGNDKVLWHSGLMKAGVTQDLDVKLAGVKTLELQVTDGGNGNHSDHANWADAIITYNGAEPKPMHHPMMIGVQTGNLVIDYDVDKDKNLFLKGITSGDGKWKSPISGLVFPVTPHPKYNYRGNGVRFKNALEVVTAGDPTFHPEYVSHSFEQEEPGIEHLSITMRDTVHAVDLELHIRAFAEYDVFEQWMVLKNDTKEVIQVPRLDSMHWLADARKGIFLEWYESQQAHESGKLMREKLTTGTKLLESRDGNRHKEGPAPHMVLGFGAQPDEDSVPCMMMALVWSGSSRFNFEINSVGTMETSIGVNQPGIPNLDAGKSMETAKMVYTFSPKGKGPASRNLHRWTRKYLLRDGDRIRLVDNNSWEGCCMNINEPSVFTMMNDSADLGIELYVLDDGWFGNKYPRDTDHCGLGDWTENAKKLPNGLASLVERADEEGIRFGIWFEPEMVSPKSELAEKHPDWMMGAPGRERLLQRSQVTLDLANPEVCEYMFSVVDRVLTENPRIRFVKWDANANINNPYSPYLGADRQGDMLNEHMAGYYGVMERLANKHPNVDFQACGAGGGRSDYGALRYSHTHWLSDNTRPSHRLGAQWNFSNFIPAMATTAHVTHADKEKYTPKYRFDVSMMAQLGMEVDTRKCTDEYVAASKIGIDAYKSVREIVQLGDLYRHMSPFDSSTPSLNFVSADKKRAFVLAYQAAEISSLVKYFTPVSGLDPKQKYSVEEINLPESDSKSRLALKAGTTKSGAEWMKNGIPLVFTRQFDSAALVLEAE